MNFLDVTFDSSAAPPKLVGPGDWTATCRLASRRRSATSGRKLVAGFRPEHLELDPVQGDTSSSRPARTSVEYLGNEELLHVTAADKDIVAIVGPDHRVKPATSPAHPPLSKLHCSTPSRAEPDLRAGDGGPLTRIPIEPVRRSIPNATSGRHRLR